MTILQMFAVLEERLNTLSRDMEDFLKPQMELLEMKIKTSEIENTFNGIDRILHKKTLWTRSHSNKDYPDETQRQKGLKRKVNSVSEPLGNSTW